MTSTVFRNSSNVVGGRVRLLPYNSYAVSFSTLNLHKKFLKYIPCIINKKTPYRKLYDECYWNSPTFTSTLYIHPDSRISRDVLRNSGYTITLSKEKADFVVIPDIDKFKKLARTYANIIAYDKRNNTTYIFTVFDQRQTFQREKFDNAGIMSSIRDSIGTSEKEIEFVYADEFLTRFPVWLIPKNEDYFDIMELELGKHLKTHYVLDTKVPFDSSFEINIETLEMCKRMQKNMLEKFIVSCPWRDYPFTLSVFISNETPTLMYSSNKNVKMVLNEIHCGFDYPASIPITPKDWNMLQKWILHKAGIDEASNGFITQEKFSDIQGYGQYIRNRIAISGMFVNDENSRNILMSYLGNKEL